MFRRAFQRVRYLSSPSSVVRRRLKSGVPDHPQPKCKAVSSNVFTHNYQHPGTPSKATTIACSLLGAIVTGGGLFVVTNLEPVAIVGRRHFVPFSRKTENKIGAKLFETEMEDAEDVILPDEDQRVVLVREVARRIADISAIPDTDWQFVVIDDPQEKNAVCYPGGRVVVYTGLLNYMHDMGALTEDTLAVILAHEIGHAVARHVLEKLTWSIPFLLATNGVFDSSPLLLWGWNMAVELPYSRQHEDEADYIGLILMARAGFDPRVAPLLWRAMDAQGGKLQITSTHPSDERRALGHINRMEEALAESRKYYGDRVLRSDRYAGYADPEFAVFVPVPEGERWTPEEEEEGDEADGEDGEDADCSNKRRSRRGEACGRAERRKRREEARKRAEGGIHKENGGSAAWWSLLFGTK